MRAARTARTWRCSCSAWASAASWPRTGWSKLLHFGERSEKFASFLPLPSPSSLALAVFGELVCASLVAVGFRTRLAAVPVVVTMLVAAFGAHRDDVLGDGEHALLFAFAFIAIALLGPGRWSIDVLVRKKSE